MTSRPSVILNLMKKDLLSLLPAIVGAAAVVIALAVYEIRTPETPPYIMLGSLLSVIAALASALVLIMAVQQDPALGERHDWRTRPIRRFDLLLAKHLFVLPALALPWLVNRLIIDIHAGYSLPEILASHAGDYAILAFVSIAIAFAATAETLVGSLVMLAVTVLAAVAGFLVFNDTIVRNLATNLFGSPLTDWAGDLLLRTLFLATGVLLVWLAYTRHRAWLSRGAFLLATFAVVTITAYALPEAAVWAAYKAAKPEMAVTRGISGGVERACLATGSSGSSTMGRGEGRVDGADFRGQARVNFEGVPAGMILLVEEGGAQINAPHDPVRSSIRPGILRAPREGVFQSDFTFLRFWADGTSPADEPRQIRADYRLTLLQKIQTSFFPLDGRRHRIEGFGWCGASGATIPVFDCFKTGQQPDLVYLTIGAGKGVCEGCRTNYRPALLEFPGGRRYKHRVISTGADGEDVGLVTTYRTVARFDRTVEGPVSVTEACGHTLAPTARPR